MRRGLAGMVSTIAIIALAPAAMGCIRTETFLEELQGEEPLIVARTEAIEWMGPDGWTPLPYETASDGTWWIPTSLAARDEDSPDWLEEHFELRLTVQVEQWLSLGEFTLLQLTPPTTLTFTAGTRSAQIQWQGRYLAMLYNIRSEVSSLPLATDCDTPRCNEREIAAAIRVLPLLSTSELDHRRIADWAVEVALDDDIWAAGLRTLEDSSLPDPEVPAKQLEFPERVPLMKFVSPSGIDRLVRAALEERRLTPRFGTSLELPFETYPDDLVTGAIERVTTELSHNEINWGVPSAILVLLRATRRKCWPEDHVAYAEDEVCVPATAMRLMDLSYSFIEDKPRLWTLLRHLWAGVVRSGRLGQTDVPVEWWRPDIVAEAERLLAELRRVEEESEEELVEP